MADDLVGRLLEASENEMFKTLAVVKKKTCRGAAARIEALERVVAAVDVLIKAKGRHNSQIAYERLVAARAAMKDPDR